MLTVAPVSINSVVGVLLILAVTVGVLGVWFMVNTY